MANRYWRTLLCLVIGILLGSVAVSAQSVDIHIGYSSSVLASRYAPIRVDLSGLDAEIDGVLRVTQHIGPPDQSPEAVTVDLVEGLLENGTYTGTIPIFDPLNPIDVAVLTPTGRVLAEQSTNVRLFQRTARFPVVSGPAISLGGLEVVVSPGELPTDWWAFECLDSLWVNGGGVSTSVWEAIARWVFAGGSVVVFTGEDYYQIDSPAFRRLFPMAHLRIETSAGGTRFLTGDAADKVHVALSDEASGIPLLYQTAYGSGTVSVISVRAVDADAESLADISALVPRADWYSLLRFGSEFRGGMRVSRPIYMIAPSLVVILLLCVGGLRWGIRKRRLTGDASQAGISMLVVLVVVIALTVWSGFYANNAKQLVELFQLEFSIQTHTTDGISLGYTGFVSPATTRIATIEREQVSVPIYALAKSTSDTSFASSTTPELFEFTIQANEVRDFRHYGSPRRLVSFGLDRETGRVSLSNSLFYELDVAFILTEGKLYEIGSIPGGDSSATLGDGVAWGIIGALSPYGDLFEAIIAQYDLDPGTWLLAVFDGVRQVPGTQVPTEVRDLELHLVEEDRT